MWNYRDFYSGISTKALTCLQQLFHNTKLELQLTHELIHNKRKLKHNYFTKTISILFYALTLMLQIRSKTEIGHMEVEFDATLL